MRRTRTLPASLRRLLAASVVACALLLPGGAGAVKLLDPAANHNVLSGVADTLHGVGIDVLQDWHSRVTIAGRPTLAPLSSYPVPRAQGDERMAREIYEGLAGGIAAFGHDNYEPLRHDNFAQQWLDAPVEKRAFISFAREDAEKADSARRVLDSRGFITFTYLRHVDAPPVWTLRDVGHFLTTAGQLFILYTPTARLKEGVIAEATAHSLYGERGVDARPARAVEVIGPHDCARTQWVVGEFEKADATVLFFDVKRVPLAKALLDANIRYLVRGRLFPLVRVNGQFILSTDANLARALKAFPAYSPSRPTRTPPGETTQGACESAEGR